MAIKIKPENRPSLTGDNEQFISRRGLCERWKKSAMTIKRWEKSGILTSYRIGRDARYKLSDIQELEDSWKVYLQ